MTAISIVGLLLVPVSSVFGQSGPSIGSATGSATAAALPGDLVLPPDFYRRELQSRLTAGFHRLPGRYRFFGDVGPNDGCATIAGLARDIAERDAGRFRLDYDRALRSFLENPGVASTPPRLLPLLLNQRFAPGIDKLLDPALIDKGSAEMMERALRWMTEQGYGGRRLGYDAGGQSFWAFNDAAPRLICAMPPERRPAMLGDWLARSGAGK